jgi:hypothetical protein
VEYRGNTVLPPVTKEWCTNVSLIQPVFLMNSAKNNVARHECYRRWGAGCQPFIMNCRLHLSNIISVIRGALCFVTSFETTIAGKNQIPSRVLSRPLFCLVQQDKSSRPQSLDWDVWPMPQRLELQNHPILMSKNGRSS